MTRRLHIGGTVACEGWEVLNAIPAAWVDHVGKAEDLSRFEDNTFAEIYASHVLEHLGYQSALPAALTEWFRVLGPGGRLMVSVPDLDTLCELYTSRNMLGPEQRFAVMRMMFGGQVDQFDFHFVGLNEELLVSYLSEAGFTEIKRVHDFGVFQDCSTLVFAGRPISLNLEARKSAIGGMHPVQQQGNTASKKSGQVEIEYTVSNAGNPPADSGVREWFDFLNLESSIRCLDVGAFGLAGDLEPWVRWAQEGCAEVLGFEPVAEECERLNQQAQERGLSTRYLPWALGDGGEHTLYLTNVPMTSSLFPPADTTLDLFTALGDLTRVERQVPVKTRRLDDIEEAAGCDFLKLDAQGAELMILQNAQHCLQSISVIQCKLEFVELYEGQPLMADVDAFLRSQGFCFHQFIYTMGRSFKPLQRADHPHLAISQMLWADAIYVRDFRKLHDWSERQLRAAAFVLHEAYQAFDLSLLILRELDRREKSDLGSCYAAAIMLSQEGGLVVDG